MRVMYVAPRYHTNQIPIMKGWLEAGDEVCFVSQYSGGTEDYSVIKPVILGYSALFQVIFKGYLAVKKITGYSKENDFEFQAKFGFLPRGKFRKILQTFEPEVVILRDRSMYNVAVTTICRKQNIPCILYTQNPYLQEDDVKDDPIRRFFRSHTPQSRITPVWGSRKLEKNGISKNTWYVPFVIEPCLSPEQKEHFQHQQVQILEVGKFEIRKNHEMLLQLAEELRDKTAFHITIAGEAVTEKQRKHLEKLKDYAKQHNIQHLVTFKTNLSREQVYEEYKKADLFVLPSTREFASISQLEAMACSLPVICSDTNGTSCYVESGDNGYLFRDNDYEDFKRHVLLLVQDKDKLLTMGEKSWRLVQEKYLFTSYKKQILNVLESLKGCE